MDARPRSRRPITYDDLLDLHDLLKAHELFRQLTEDPR